MQIGSKPQREPADISELLLACHGRIRQFIQLAPTLADSKDAPTEQIRDAAQRVGRYFGEALPLHVADEEETVLPRLRGRSPALDAALARMHHEHAAHGRGLGELLALCGKLEHEPARLDELRDALREVAGALAIDFEAHLASEEATIVPAIERWLDAAEQAAMLAELRQRRDLR